MSIQLFSRVQAEEVKAEVKVPKPWRDAGPDDLYDVRGVCLDIDDTLSTGGKLTSEAYSALWNLKEAGFGVVPVTGRPAGWCDHIARFWPVDAVVGENGAFTFLLKKGFERGPTLWLELLIWNPYDRSSTN